MVQKIKFMSNPYCVIMAGGVGSRFWPMSTSQFPKQFHDILGTGETLIQNTFRRLQKITSADKILVVTHKDYKDLVAEQLTEMPIENIILEPARRNTAPCISYAAFKIRAKDPNAKMIVAPSDHLITNDDEFIRVINLGLDFSEKSDQLITMGIKPHRPDTGYGYIQFIQSEMNGEVKPVKTFTEKPNLEIAKEFIESGDFLWNSGIFIWSIPTFMTALQKHQSDLFSSFEAGQNLFNTEKEEGFIENMYPSCENESIDYGVMEKSTNVSVIPADFGWSDLGTWGSLYEHMPKDNNNNALIANKLQVYDSSDNIIRVPKGKIAVVEGLESYIVVDTKNALLICKKDNEQLIKTFVSDIKLNFGKQSV